jgi:hypothetical protein
LLDIFAPLSFRLAENQKTAPVKSCDYTPIQAQFVRLLRYGYSDHAPSRLK